MTILTRYNFHHHRTSQIKLEKPPIYSSHLLCCAVPISSHLGSFIIWFECEKQIKFNSNHNFYGAVRCFLLFVFFPLARSIQHEMNKVGSTSYIHFPHTSPSVTI